jgi:hypothetical protein
MKKPEAKFLVLANCPLRTVHKTETRAEGERWAKKNREYYRSMGSSLCVIANKPLVRKKPAKRKKAAPPISTVPEGLVTGGTWTEVGRKD